ncbi:MAG: hypothetical protein VYD19_09835, partial [Myxococcota bacterium]|nr:hypothetical protein [Myxococcota bacterium]
YQAFEGGHRVVLIEEAERLNLAAANALLKTLEEPSPGTYFILLSDAPERLLPTIRSRCQLIRFSPLEVRLLQTLLQELHALAEEEAAFIARLSEGSLGRAEALIESELLGERVELLETLDREARLQGVEGRLKRAEQLAKRPEEELRLLLHLLRSWFRDVLFCRHDLSGEVLVHRDREAQLRARAEVLDEQGLRWRLEALDEAERQLFDRHSDRRLILENLFLYLGGGAALFRRPLKL